MSMTFHRELSTFNFSWPVKVLHMLRKLPSKNPYIYPQGNSYTKGYSIKGGSQAFIAKNEAF